MKTFLALLLTTLGLFAQPVEPPKTAHLEIVIGNEGYDPVLQGLTSGGFLSSFGSYSSSVAALDSSLLEPSVSNQAQQVIMYFRLDVINRGEGDCALADVFKDRAKFVYKNGKYYLKGFWEASLTDTNGKTVREVMGEWSPIWDGYGALEGVPRKFNRLNVGISSGCAAVSSHEPTQTGAQINITGLKGRYTFRVALNPMGDFPIPLTEVSTQVTIDVFNVHLYPPPPGAVATPAAPPLPAETTNTPAPARRSFFRR